MQWVLTVTNGPEAGRQFECTGDDIYLIGCAEYVHFRFREDSDRYMSGVHCLLEVHTTRCLLLDLQSTNGTIVNAKKVGRAELRDGDQIRLGDTILKVRAVMEPDSPRGGDVFCIRCGEQVTQEVKRALPGLDVTKLQEVAYTCLACQAATEAAEAGTRQVECHCLQCKCDMSERANADGRAAELQEVALYLCDRCVQERDTRQIKYPWIDKYKLLATLGEGGMAEVFRAWHQPTGRFVALKRMLSSLQDERAPAWFKREIDSLKALYHPHIVSWIDDGLHDGRPYLVSEFMRNGDLLQVMNDKFKGPLTAYEAVTYVTPLLDALAHAHRQGFVHRDITLRNILLTRSPNGQEIVKLGDFGLAKSFIEAGGSFLTEVGESLGKLHFMAPEQLRNYKYVGPSADVYSIGVVLYFLLSGGYPLKGLPNPSPEAILTALRIPLQKRNPGVPEALAKVVDKAVERERDERYERAHQLKDALQDVLSKLQ